MDWTIKISRKRRTLQRRHDRSAFDVPLLLKSWPSAGSEIVRWVGNSDLLRLRRTSSFMKRLADNEIQIRQSRGDFWPNPSQISSWGRLRMSRWITRKYISYGYISTPNELRRIRQHKLDVLQDTTYHDWPTWEYSDQLELFQSENVLFSSYYRSARHDYYYNRRDSVCHCLDDGCEDGHDPYCPVTAGNIHDHILTDADLRRDSRLDIMLNPRLLLPTGEFKFF